MLKFDHLIEHNKINIFLEKQVGNEAGRPVLDLFSFFDYA